MVHTENCGSNANARKNHREKCVHILAQNAYHRGSAYHASTAPKHSNSYLLCFSVGGEDLVVKIHLVSIYGSGHEKLLDDLKNHPRIEQSA